MIQAMRKKLYLNKIKKTYRKLCKTGFCNSKFSENKIEIKTATRLQKAYIFTDKENRTKKLKLYVCFG